jgi:phosphatidylethanolamine/phosphatidyl-N-methylethanolamine N-methyltransferase
MVTSHLSPKAHAKASRERTKQILADQAHFLKTLIDRPRLTGSVAPSGRHLARAMASPVDPAREGLVIELGPGTGPVTQALIERGLARDRLVLVEYDHGFCRLLGQRFAPARIVQGDAYDLPRTLRDLGGAPIVAVVSSLPLLNEPPARRIKLIEDAFALMGPQGLLVQFTYGLGSPIPREACAQRFSAHCTAPIWRNLPPARVWTYRADAHGPVAEPLIARLMRQAAAMPRRASGC